MSIITRDRILVGVTINVVAFTIDVLWADRLIEDGQVIGQENHRGAYPINAQMEFDDDVRSLLGASLQDIIGATACVVQKKLIAANNLASELNVSLAHALDSIEALTVEKNSLIDSLNVSSARIAELEALHAGTE